MEGVGARLGRSSTRYGPATVFSGPVRKWKKTWVPLSSSSSSNNNSTSSSSNGNGGGSHLLLYKWTPIPPSQPKEAPTPSPAAATDEPPRRKYKYIPVSVIEEQKKEAAVKFSEEDKPNDPSGRAVQTDGLDEKSDVKDAIMEEVQASEKDVAPASQAPETNLDLSLGFKAREEDSDSDPKFMQQAESSLPGEDIEMRTATNSEVENKTKRKATTPDLEMRV